MKTYFVGIYFDFFFGKHDCFICADRNEIPANAREMRCIIGKEQAEYHASVLERFFIPSLNKVS